VGLPFGDRLHDDGGQGVGAARFVEQGAQAAHHVGQARGIDAVKRLLAAAMKLPQDSESRSVQ
jgi:hypothetical protein